MIEIEDLREKTKEDIIKHILDEKKQPYEIYVPKSTQRFNSENIDIAVDYLQAAYSGQKLYEISEKFEYDVISPDYHESILFEIECTDIEKLANALLDISYIYVNDHPDPEFIANEELEWFLEDIKNKKFKPACPEFLDYYEEFLEEDQKNEESESEE